MNINNTKKIAQTLVSMPKGLLAADESTPSMNKRLAKVGVKGNKAWVVSF